MTMTKIEKAFSKYTEVGDLVVYFKDQETNRWLDGKGKKNIWKVKDIWQDNINWVAQIISPNGDKFETKTSNILSLKYLVDNRLINKYMFTSQSYGLYRTFIGLEDIDYITDSLNYTSKYDRLSTQTGRFNSKQESKSNKPKGKKLMKNTKIVDENVDAAKIAAKITAGKTLNTVVMQKVRPQLPMLARGYADHPLANVVIANIASFAVANFATDNEKAKYATDAMMQAAMLDFMQMFNIEDIIAEVLSTAKVEIPKEAEVEIVVQDK